MRISQEYLNCSKIRIMNNEILLYQTEDGLTEIEVALENETVWLTQRQMAELFQKDSDTIGLHIRNIYRTCLHLIAGNKV